MLFAKSRVPDFLKVPDPKKISGRPYKLEQWVQIDWYQIEIRFLYITMFWQKIKTKGKQDSRKYEHKKIRNAQKLSIIGIIKLI